MRALRVLLAVATFVLLATSSQPSRAGSASASLDVSVVVDGACLVSTSPLVFGTYEPLGANATSPLDASTVITVTCTAGAGGTLVVDRGAHQIATYARMTDGAHYVLYDLYQDSARTTNWNAVTEETIPPAPDMTPREFGLYGRVPAGQTSPPGSYSDTVGVVLNF